MPASDPGNPTGDPIGYAVSGRELRPIFTDVDTIPSPGQGTLQSRDQGNFNIGDSIWRQLPTGAVRGNIRRHPGSKYCDIYGC